MLNVMEEAIKNGIDGDGELNGKTDALIQDLNIKVSMKGSRGRTKGAWSSRISKKIVSVEYF